jgi:hypothetical protein
MSESIRKEITFHKKDWTVEEVEEAMWRIRAAGGTDETPLLGIEFIMAEDLDITPLDVPQRSAVPDPLPRPIRVAAQFVGAMLAVPVVVLTLVYLWGRVFGLL